MTDVAAFYCASSCETADRVEDFGILGAVHLLISRTTFPIQRAKLAAAS